MGRRGDLNGVHTILTAGPDEDFAWPPDDDTLRSPRLHKVWDKDKNEKPLPPPQFDFREYERPLLAALARRYRGETVPLPMIPVAMAEWIIGVGGLEAWLNRDHGRVRRFWEMVDRQRNATPLQPLSKSERAIRAKQGKAKSKPHSRAGRTTSSSMA